MLANQRALRCTIDSQQRQGTRRIHLNWLPRRCGRSHKTGRRFMATIAQCLRRSAAKIVVVPALGLAAVSLVAATGAEARVVKIVVDKKASPAFDGASFGNAGQYETLAGRAFGELDPNDPHNAIIQDIKLAPRNSRGMVEYTASFQIVKPVDMTKSASPAAGRATIRAQPFPGRTTTTSSCRSPGMPTARRSPAASWRGYRMHRARPRSR
jgi:hypothetical protein